MKLIKSKCEKAWLFDCKVDDNWLTAGFACFLSECSDAVSVLIKDRQLTVEVPMKAVNNLVPTRIINARLAVLSSDTDE